MVTFKETEHYFIVQSGNKYWYWTKDGTFDGTSWDYIDERGFGCIKFGQSCTHANFKELDVTN